MSSINFALIPPERYRSWVPEISSREIAARIRAEYQLHTAMDGVRTAADAIHRAERLGIRVLFAGNNDDAAQVTNLLDQVGATARLLQRFWGHFGRCEMLVRPEILTEASGLGHVVHETLHGLQLSVPILSPYPFLSRHPLAPLAGKRITIGLQDALDTGLNSLGYAEPAVGIPERWDPFQHLTWRRNGDGSLATLDPSEIAPAVDRLTENLRPQHRRDLRLIVLHERTAYHAARPYYANPSHRDACDQVGAIYEEILKGIVSGNSR
jgi:hypothetical protein